MLSVLTSDSLVPLLPKTIIRKHLYSGRKELLVSVAEHNSYWLLETLCVLFLLLWPWCFFLMNLHNGDYTISIAIKNCPIEPFSVQQTPQTIEIIWPRASHPTVFKSNILNIFGVLHIFRLLRNVVRLERTTYNLSRWFSEFSSELGRLPHETMIYHTYQKTEE